MMALRGRDGLLAANFAVACVATFAEWPRSAPAMQDPEPPDPSSSEVERSSPDLEPQITPKELRLSIDPGIQWNEGPGSAQLGSIARIELTDGIAATDKEGSARLLRATGNLVGGAEIGILWSDRSGWWVTFEYVRGDGHIKDDEKDDLDAGAMLDQKRELAAAGNEERRRLKLDELTVVGWSVPPHYDEKSHNLEWGLRLHDSHGVEAINYEVRLLARLGYVGATLVCVPEDFNDALPEFRALLAKLSFTSGESYQEVKQGDPISEIGLTALVTGGAAALAWKTGLLGKLLKFAKFIAVAVLAGIGGVWKWITGRRSRSRTP